MIGNKKPRHPAGVFRMGSLGITPVVPYSPCAYRCSYYCVELPVPDESIIEKFQVPGQPQRAGIVVSICVQDRLKTVPGLSAEIGDNFIVWNLDNRTKMPKLIIFKPILLAKNIKTAHKKTDLFPSRLNTIVLEGMT